MRRKQVGDFRCPAVTIHEIDSFKTNQAEVGGQFSD